MEYGKAYYQVYVSVNMPQARFAGDVEDKPARFLAIPISLRLPTQQIRPSRYNTQCSVGRHAGYSANCLGYRRRRRVYYNFTAAQTKVFSFRSEPMREMSVFALYSVFLATWVIYAVAAATADWQGLNVPAEHVPMIFNSQPSLREACRKDKSCPYKDVLNYEVCWGYEDGCTQKYLPDFTENCNREEKYWVQGDFGKIRQSLDQMKTRHICKSNNAQGASLKCTKNADLCVAKNLYLHLPTVDQTEDNQVVVPKDGSIGGYCNLDEKLLSENTNFKRSLATWGIQLQSFKSLKFDPFENGNRKCDVVMEKPVVFVQLDAVGNLYHHFCDFFNLYLTQHMNNSWFGTDVQIVRWNNHPRFRDPFMDAWTAFTDLPVLSLHNFAGKKVCMSSATFAFLPRMVHGLYYSTYLQEGCRGSRMVKSFTDHFLHRMGITRKPEPDASEIRVTFLQRGANNDRLVLRRVLNMDALLKRMKKIPNFKVKVVSYDFGELSFLEQLRITANTDIFIGMHGAGLAHFLFLPDWAIAFELYNCGDFRCYRDLAALRGLQYLTWEDESKVEAHDQGKHKQYGDHAKFWNFTFDVEEFVRLVRKARDLLLSSKKFPRVGTKTEL